MEEVKSPSEEMEEIITTSKVVGFFINRSENPERARKQLQPFMLWLFDSALEAVSEMEEENGL